MRDLATRWKNLWRSGKPESFDDLAREWEIVCQEFARPLSKTRDQRSLCEALVKLVAVADQVCEGVGASRDQTAGEYNPIQDVGADLLVKTGTLCLGIDPSRLRVLPRMHTPQNGLTERSLSRYLSLCDAGEVTPQWHFSPFPQKEMNLLLIPWPFEVVINGFRAAADTAGRLPKDFGFFALSSDSGGRFDDLTRLVVALHAEGERKLGRIDGVVLPELSITNDQFDALRTSLPPECFLIAGVGRGASDGLRGTNQVRLSFPQLADVVQRKHHPWKLDESQVIQYGLGGVLSPYREWWEYIDCTDRYLILFRSVRTWWSALWSVKTWPVPTR